ncbi:glycosyltransferase family 39 protein [Bradyrhizobium sp. WYCCWR 13022]|uniref:glycosyltransferase family 39 protein n=1 Tax=Bradyrhizobium TaxID=374 RepID=UPI002162A21B|nr:MULTISPECIES: glycosyltransferase family 39 protein [Bradyrhizobium]MDN4983490.1 glycosyltransferase family 39 protein [Bradyrhizobium sp. WYCCWR 13022]
MDDRPPNVAAPSGGRLHASGRWLPTDAFDRATLALVAALAVAVLYTFRDYAVSNDEVVQHRYGQLILDYYLSGLRDRDVFNLDNLYLYGGLFDVVAVALGRLLPIDVFDLRHILCALIGVGGIAATAATARLVAGPRAGLLAALSLALCGPWYGAMFNHTKDIPFAVAMIGATLVLIRMGRRMSSPSRSDILALGLLTGAALGLRVLGLLILVQVGFAMALYLPWSEGARRHSTAAAARLLPALGLAYLVMIVAWPWSALSPMNPIRGLLAFSDFDYPIRTLFAGQVYEMGDVPRAYVPVYIMIRTSPLTLAGATLAVAAAMANLRGKLLEQQKDVAVLSLAIAFPVACQVVFRGPAFTGMRHFLFVIPPLAVLAGVGLNKLLAMTGSRSRVMAACCAAVIGTGLTWDASVLYRLHPYENLYYNSLVGGLAGAFRRYDLDYWFNSMPEAIHRLEAYVRTTTPKGLESAKVYSVATCGDRKSFERTVTLPQLRWDFKPEWNQSEFFIAPTHMNCDQDLDGKIVATVERFGVPLAYVKDRRSMVQNAPTQAAESRSVPVN